MKPPELSSLPTGIMADKNINSNEAFEIETIAQKQIEGKRFGEIQVKRRFCCEVSFVTITKSVTIRNNTVCVNPDNKTSTSYDEQLS